MSLTTKNGGAANAAAPKLNKSILDRLFGLSIDESAITARRSQLQKAEFVAGRFALKSQITVLFAGPNTGKTLITLAAVSEAKAAGLISEHIFHLNLDDDFTGLTTKAEIGLSKGFNVLAPEVFLNPKEDIEVLVDSLVTEGLAASTVFIIDTVKKFGDVMDKKGMSHLFNQFRRLSGAGGTVIVLAHTNKNNDDPEKSVPGGVSDLLDDSDAAYLLYVSATENMDNGVKTYVTFEQKKSRGPNATRLVYSYVRPSDADYIKLFNSVRYEDDDAIEKAETQAELLNLRSTDKEIIEAIKTFIQSTDCPTKTNLIQSVTSSTTYSRNVTSRCLERWCKPEDAGGLWYSEKLPENNAQAYRLYCQ